jgi:hypothetical protein
MVVALIALIAATAGVGYAAGKIAGSEIRTGSIAGKKLKPGAVKSKQIKDGGVNVDDLAAGVIPAVPDTAATSFTNEEVVEPLAADPDFTTVASLSGLDAGNYLLLGKARVYPTPSGGLDETIVRCQLRLGDAVLDQTHLQVGENVADSSVLQGPIPVHAAASVPQGAEIVLECSGSTTTIAISADLRSLIALRIGSLN